MSTTQDQKMSKNKDFKYEEMRRKLTGRARRLGCIIFRHDSLKDIKTKIKRAWR